jgi:uncharacterized repeat protein (TIGR01451 family)
MATLCALALPTASAFAEGSVDINTGPDSSNRQGLSLGIGTGTDAASVGNTALFVYARAGETIQLASSAMGVGTGNAVLYPPPGAITTPVWNCVADDPGTGLVPSGAAGRQQELAGPEPTAGDADPNTYKACEYVVPAGGDGIYRVVFTGTDTVTNNGPGTVANPIQGTGANVAIWDITVRDSADVVQPGRAYSYRYTLRTGADGSSGAEVFVQTKTGYEYKVNFENQGGANWTLNSDDVGVVDAATGKPLYASFACGPDDGTNLGCTHNEATFGPQSGWYPLFLNAVDPIVVSGPGGLAETRGFATSPISPASNPLSSSFAGTDGTGKTDRGSGGTFAFTSPTQMAGLGYTLEIDTNRDGTFGNGSDYVHDTSELSDTGANSWTWDGKDAAGNVPSCGDYNYRIRATLAEVHFPMLDVEFSGGTRIERLTLPDDPALGSPFAASYNDIDPFKPGTYDVLPGTDPTVVNDGDSSAPGFHAWGAGPFGNGDGNQDYIDTWAKLPEVVTTGTLRLLCADMAITKKAQSSPAVPGSTITYDLVIKNNGPDTGTDVKVTDPLPAGLTFLNTSSAECAGSGQSFTCSLGDLAPGASKTVQLTASVDSALTTGNLANTATVSNDTPDPDPSNNTSTETVPVEPQADLEIVKLLESDKVVPGKTAKWKLVVTNHGPSPARNVKLSDDLPKGLTYVSSTPSGCSVASGTITCTVGSTLNAGQSRTFEVTTKVASSVKGKVVNTAKVTSDTKDPVPDNNEDKEGPDPDPQADLQIDKVPSVTSVTRGEQLFYTLIVMNNGPSDADDVTITDNAAPGLTLLSAQSDQGTCKTAAAEVTCAMGTVPVGGTVQVLVSARADAIGTLVDDAHVRSTTPDPHPENDDDTEKVTSTGGPNDPYADLEIVKTSNVKSVTGSGSITYTLTVINHGPATSSTTKVTDTPELPVKVTSIKPSQGTCTTKAPITCQLGTLAPGAKATIKVVARPLAAGALRNSASVTGDKPDPKTDNNMDGKVVQVRGLLKISKVASVRTVVAGGTVSYRIRVTNASAFGLKSVKVCDDLPSGLVYVSSSPRAKLSSGRYCWTVATLGAKKSKSFTIKAKVLKGANGRKVNVATATAPNARGAKSKAATDSAAIHVKGVAVRGGGVTG